MIDRLAVFGVTGDLAARLLFPAVAQLAAAGRLPESFRVVGAAREDWDDHRFRRHVAERLGEYAHDVPASARDSLVRRSSYRSADVTDTDAVRAVLGDIQAQGPVAAYLGLPTGLMPAAVAALAGAGLPGGSRIAIEKPFGEDLAGARKLNALLAEALGNGWEQVVFRVDHALGMPAVQGLPALRFGNRVLEPLWNSKHIEEIQVLWEETLALEGRAAFYDRAGALKDVMQNHMMQVLGMVGMEPPGIAPSEVGARRLEFLRAVAEPSPDDVLSGTRRARYTAGRLADTGGADGRLVPDYAEEEGVDQSRDTETLAEVVLRVDNPRWSGTRFRLRAGKALSERRKGVVVRFRPTDAAVAGNELWLGVDGPNDVRLGLFGGAGAPFTLSGSPQAPDLSPYAHVLLDLFEGGDDLSVGGDEAEEAWRILTPVLEAWAAGRVPMEEYAAGSNGAWSQSPT